MSPVADAVVAENTQARLDGLQAALANLALIALIALFFARGIPTLVSPAPRESQNRPLALDPADTG